MGYRVVKVPRYVKTEVLKQAERLDGDYTINCFLEKYNDFVKVETFEIELSSGQWFEFIPDVVEGNDWLDELYNMKNYINNYLEKIK